MMEGENRGKVSNPDKYQTAVRLKLLKCADWEGRVRMTLRVSQLGMHI